MKNDYNFIAPFYDLIVQIVFGNRIFKAQTEYLSDLPDDGKILFIGGGSGKVLKHLVLLKPNLKIDYIDTSRKMIKMSQKNVKGIKHSINFITGNENDIPSIEYDAILTFFFLDLFESNKREEIFLLLSGKLRIGGSWLMADFNIPKTFLQKFIMTSMFSFLKLTTHIEAKKIEDYTLLFKSKEYKLIKNKSFYSNFIFSSLYSN